MEYFADVHVAATQVLAGGLYIKTWGASCGRLWPVPPVGQPMLVRAGKLFGIGRGVRMRGSFGIALERDRRHADQRELGQPFFQIVVFSLVVGQADPSTVIVDRDIDMIRVLESRRAAVEGGVVEIRRCELPDKPREFLSVLLRNRRGRGRWRSKTGTTRHALRRAAVAFCWLHGCR
jgi:hypothetical protein